jgi:hypothetical protein
MRRNKTRGANVAQYAGRSEVGSKTNGAGSAANSANLPNIKIPKIKLSTAEVAMTSR